jgi:ATP-dependent protease ClpP protease subunit
MRYYNLDTEENLSIETLNSFSAWLGELEASEDYGRVNLASPGGDVSIALCMVDMINQSEKIKEIYVYSACCSAGLFFITDCMCDVYISDKAYSIFHAPARTLNMRDVNNKTSMVYALNEYDKQKDQEERENYMSIGLTEQEIADIYDMKDIFLDASRLREIRETCVTNFPILENALENTENINTLTKENSGDGLH